MGISAVRKRNAGAQGAVRFQHKIDGFLQSSIKSTRPFMRMVVLTLLMDVPEKDTLQSSRCYTGSATEEKLSDFSCEEYRTTNLNHPLSRFQQFISSAFSRFGLT